MASILDQVPYNNYTGNGVATAYPFEFELLDAGDFVASIDGVEVPGSDYTLSGLTQAGGTCTFDTAPANGSAVLLQRVIALERDTDYQYNGDLREETLDRDFNRGWQALQGLRAQVGGALRLPYPEQADELPAAADRADKLLSFDSSGNPIATAPVAGTATALALALASTASAADGAAMIARGAQIVDSVTALRGLLKTAPSKYAYLTGYSVAGDLGAQCYYYDSTDTTSADNPGSVVVATDGGRWKAITGNWLVNASAFGVKADNGSTDNTARLLAAITYGQLTRRSVLLPSGGDNAIGMATTLVLSGNPISIYGDLDGPWQQGSTRPCTTLRWYGGADPMIELQSSGWVFEGFAADNFGTATDVFYTDSTVQHLRPRRLSFLVGSGASRFSRAIFYSLGNGFGYSVFDAMSFQGAAPSFLEIDGNGSGNGVTPIEICGRSVFESNALGNVSIVKIIDENLDSLHIHHCTFNPQANELCIVNIDSATALDPAITQLTFEENEWDVNTSIAGDRMMRLKNCPNVAFNKNTCNGGGIATALVELVNSTVESFDGNYVERLAGPVFNADSTSRVYPGKNELKVANTAGIVNDSLGVVPLTYGTTVTILGQKIPQGWVARVNVTNGVGWTLSLAHPGIGSGGYFYVGQVFGIQVRNTSGGAMGAITLAGTYFKLAGGAFPAPANGNSRTVWLMWDGTNLVEVNRTTADIPN